MSEMLSLIKTSKTAKSGVVTIAVGLLLLLGIVNPQDITGGEVVSIDDMGNGGGGGGQTQTERIVGIGALLSGFMTLWGRSDAQKRIKGLEDEKAKE